VEFTGIRSSQNPDSTLSVLSIFRSANFQGRHAIQSRFIVNSPEGEGRNQSDHMTDAAIAWAQLLVSTPGSEAGLIGHAWPDCGDAWRMAEDVRFPPETRQKRREQTRTNTHDFVGETLILLEFSGRALRS
jgi:hypothetical protein